MASVSPCKALLMRRNSASFSASRSSAVTRKPSSGRDGSLRGSPHLRGNRGTLCFRGLGEQFLWDRSNPQVASSSFSCWLFLWENTEAEGA